MVLNPFYIILSIYIFSNSYALLKLQENGGFEVFGYFREVSQTSSFLAYLFQMLFLLVILFYYKKFTSYKGKILRLSNTWGYVILIVSISFFIFNIHTGAGLAGSGFKFEGYNPLNILFVILQPDLLVLLIAPFIASKRLFLTVLLVFFLSVISRGWMGSVLFVFIIFLIRFYPIRINLINSFYLFIFSIMIFISLPLLDALKWGMRSGLSFNDSLATLQDKNYWDILGVVLVSVIERFQHLNYAAYITQNSTTFFNDLFSGDFLWFFQSGILNSIYCNIFGCTVDLTTHTAEVLFGEKGLTWNVDPGLSGWVSLLRYLSIIFILFIVYLLYLAFYVFYRHGGHSGILLVACFSLLYLFNGWLGAFYNFVLYAFIISYVSRFSLSPPLKNTTGTL